MSMDNPFPPHASPVPLPPPPPPGSMPSPPPGPMWPGPVPPAPAAPRLSKAVIVGLITAALGFVEISFSSSRTVNGVVTDCSYLNLAPWIFGPVALVAGITALAGARAAGAAGSRNRALGALCIVLGAVHLLRGLGVIELLTGSPC